MKPAKDRGQQIWGVIPLTPAQTNPIQPNSILCFFFFVCMCRSVSGGACSTLASRLPRRVIARLGASIRRSTPSGFLHYLQLQPVVVLRLRPYRLFPNCRHVSRLDYASDRRLAAHLGLHRALPIYLVHGCMRCGRLVHKHHLVAVRRNLTASPLVEVSRALAGVGPAGIARKVHLVPHLNPTCFTHVCRHVSHLLHQVLLVRHLEALLLRLLVLLAHWGKRAHLQSVRDVLVAGSCK